MMQSVDCKTHSKWLEIVLEAIKYQGYCVVEGVLDASFLADTRHAMYRAQVRIVEEIGEVRLKRAGELGILRLMMKFEPHFFRFLDLPQLLSVVDYTVSSTAILHLQNGFILPSFATEKKAPRLFQNNYHQDFPRVLNGYVASVNAFFAIDEFTRDNGATWVVPATHQRATLPDPDYLQACGIPLECPAGSMIVFDSTLWHAAGNNISSKDRLAINHQFTRSYIKQQIDYVRALGEEVISRLKPRTQQLLGYYTRVVTSLDEYYRPEEERLYRKGQG